MLQLLSNDWFSTNVLGSENEDKINNYFIVHHNNIKYFWASKKSRQTQKKKMSSNLQPKFMLQIFFMYICFSLHFTNTNLFIITHKMSGWKNYKMIGNERKWRNEGLNLRNNKEPKVIPHHTWVFFLKILFTYPHLISISSAYPI